MYDTMCELNYKAEFDMIIVVIDNSFWLTIFLSPLISYKLCTLVILL